MDKTDELVGEILFGLLCAFVLMMLIGAIKIMCA